MIFTTYWFFAFTAITLAVYWLLPVATLRWWSSPPPAHFFTVTVPVQPGWRRSSR